MPVPTKPTGQLSSISCPRCVAVRAAQSWLLGGVFGRLTFEASPWQDACLFIKEMSC